MKIKTRNSLSWKPVRHGAIYCAPACGGNCTWKAYQRAHKEAAQTVRRLKTKGWKIQVWENLGWHWALVNTICGISLHITRCPQRGLMFWTMISSTPESSSGDCGIQYSDTCKDPNKAVRQQIKRAMPYYEFEAQAFENLKRFANTLK